VAAGAAEDLAGGLRLAGESIRSGAAAQKLAALRDRCRRPPAGAGEEPRS
jgi:anthranilate phosphoribosyltransferase